MPDLITLQGYLLEAELALHKLLIGKSEQQVSYEGKSVTFRENNIDRLRDYIAWLKLQISILQGRAVGRGPIHFTF